MQNKLIIYLVLVLGILSNSCSVFVPSKERNPASSSSSSSSSSFAQIYNEINTANQLNSIDSLVCKNSYDELYNKLFTIVGQATYFDVADLKTIDADIQASFETRLAIKESFGNFSIKNSDDKACLKSAQDVFSAIRYIEDYLIESRMDKITNPPNEYVSMIGNFPYLLINPKFIGEFRTIKDLKSGDVILSRGNAYSSAAIASITETNYQFSHLSLVYKDQESKELFTSEAHIEIGSVVTPFQKHISEKNVRSVIFRFKDEDVAERASKIMVQKIKKQQELGINIQYDFSMNYRDDSRLFCSEIISNGYKLALPDSDYLPKFTSKLKKGIVSFVRTIGVPVTSKTIENYDIFAPGDIQFDPHFDLVAEWRNPKKMEESRFKDYVLTKMFERMENEGYKIDPTIKMDAESKGLWLLRRTPLIKQFLEKRFALNMNAPQLELFIALDKIANVIYQNLKIRSHKYARKMTPKEILLEIDEFIKKDYFVYKNYKSRQKGMKPMFHLLFHP
jgi:hypothetical protein